MPLFEGANKRHQGIVLRDSDWSICGYAPFRATGVATLSMKERGGHPSEQHNDRCFILQNLCQFLLLF